MFNAQHLRTDSYPVWTGLCDGLQPAAVRYVEATPTVARPGRGLAVVTLDGHLSLSALHDLAAAVESLTRDPAVRSVLLVVRSLAGQLAGLARVLSAIEAARDRGVRVSCHVWWACGVALAVAAAAESRSARPDSLLGYLDCRLLSDFDLSDWPPDSAAILTEALRGVVAAQLPAANLPYVNGWSCNGEQAEARGLVTELLSEHEHLTICGVWGNLLR